MEATFIGSYSRNSSRDHLDTALYGKGLSVRCDRVQGVSGMADPINVQTNGQRRCVWISSCAFPTIDGFRLYLESTSTSEGESVA